MRKNVILGSPIRGYIGLYPAKWDSSGFTFLKLPAIEKIPWRRDE